MANLIGDNNYSPAELLRQHHLAQLKIKEKQPFKKVDLNKLKKQYSEEEEKFLDLEEKYDKIYKMYKPFFDANPKADPPRDLREAATKASNQYHICLALKQEMEKHPLYNFSKPVYKIEIFNKVRKVIKNDGYR